MNRETHWIALYVNDDNVTYFDCFGAERIPKEMKKFTANKNVTTNIYRIKANSLIISGYFCIEFINFMPKVEVCEIIPDLFSPNKY